MKAWIADVSVLSRLAKEDREREEVIAQHQAAMLAAQTRKPKAEASPLAQIDLGNFFRKLVGILTRQARIFKIL
jgi:hypothetical protein